jgi:hypothetical protein
MSAIGLAIGALGTPSEALNYPLCGQNCGFSTREQCMADVSGIGGFCESNNLYVPKTAGTAATSSPHRRMRHKSHKNS